MKKDTGLAKALINFYNTQAASALSPSSSSNQSLVAMAIKKTEGDAAPIKQFIEGWVVAHPAENYEDYLSRFEECFTEFILAPTEMTPEKQAKKDDVTVATGLNVLTKAVTEAVIAVSKDKIEEGVMTSVKDTVRQFIKDEYGVLEKKVNVVVNGEKREVKGVLHPEFDTVLQFIAQNEAIYLAGPAGSGKNIIAKQVADALGLAFHFTNAVTQEYKITGYGDAMGVFHSEPFYEAFTKGGLFFLDEMDASIPEVLIILNAAIANGYFVFPAPIGYKEAHPDFRVIAAGNTSGRGANYEYTGRNQLDGASLDRFGYDYIDYYEGIEVECAGGDAELARFCREFRNAAKKVGVSMIVSYRGIKRLAKMLAVLPIEKALQTCLIKDLEKDDINIIARELPTSKYRKALYDIYEKM